jgi:hypothetical protein
LERCYVQIIQSEESILTECSTKDEEEEEKRQKASKEADDDDLDSFMEKMDTVKSQRPSKTNLQKELQKLIKVGFVMSA